MPEDRGATRTHRGDIMSPEKRSALMSRIRGSGTKPETRMVEALAAAGLELERHPKDVTGRPDFVDRASKTAVFVDGDFWHGYRFAQWRRKLSERWEAKIAANRRRDRMVNRELRAAGWTVLRFWEHDVEAGTHRCARKVSRTLRLKDEETGQSESDLVDSKI